MQLKIRVTTDEIWQKQSTAHVSGENVGLCSAVRWKVQLT